MAGPASPLGLSFPSVREGVGPSLWGPSQCLPWAMSCPGLWGGLWAQAGAVLSTAIGYRGQPGAGRQGWGPGCVWGGQDPCSPACQWYVLCETWGPHGWPPRPSASAPSCGPRPLPPGPAAPDGISTAEGGVTKPPETLYQAPHCPQGQCRPLDPVPQHPGPLPCIRALRCGGWGGAVVPAAPGLSLRLGGHHHEITGVGTSVHSGPVVRLDSPSMKGQPRNARHVAQVIRPEPCQVPWEPDRRLGAQPAVRGGQMVQPLMEQLCLCQWVAPGQQDWGSLGWVSTGWGVFRYGE